MSALFELYIYYIYVYDLITAIFFAIFLGPNPVLNLAASAKSTSSLEVQWSYPQGAQTHYAYFVWGPKINQTVGTNRTEITDLDPGMRYRIKVQTKAEKCESTEEETHAYTSKS